jgi:cytochrome c oxidase subunit II
LKSRVAFAFAIAVLLSGTAFHFVQPWLPQAANQFASSFDAAWKWNLLLLGMAFIATHAMLATLVFKSRKGASHAYSQPSWRSEVAWAAIAVTLFVGLAAASTRTWEKNKPIGQDSQGLKVEVTGQQFRWYFRYPGPDQKFGRTDLHLADAAEGNPLGLDRNDPASIDDRVSTVLIVGAKREIEVDLRSYDVIHSFFIPELRFKQDAVPGMTIPAHFSFDRPGEFEIACAELCGLGHHQMNAKVKVLSTAEFAKWEAH